MAAGFVLMVLGFKKRFVPLVLDGSKRHTIRDDAGDRWQVGTIAHPYQNVRQRGMALIIEPRPVRRTERIRIESLTGRGVSTGLIFIDSVILSPAECDALAWADGFRFRPDGSEYKGEGEYTDRRPGCFRLMLNYWARKDGKPKSLPYSGKIVHF